jgi:hypothetical protein
MNSKKEKIIFSSSLILLLVSNLNVIPLLAKIPHGFVDNEYVNFIQTASSLNKKIPPNERVGFLTTVETEKVFIEEKAVKKFFMIQYAVVPRILDTNIDADTNYIIAVADNLKYKKILISRKFQLDKVINKDIIVFKRVDND